MAKQNKIRDLNSIKFGTIIAIVSKLEKDKLEKERKAK